LPGSKSGGLPGLQHELAVQVHARLRGRGDSGDRLLRRGRAQRFDHGEHAGAARRQLQRARARDRHRLARQAGKAIRWDLPADLRTPLQCEASYNCVPAVGAQFTLGGGFVRSRADRSATVANLTVAFQDVNGSPGPVVTATFDGAPITLIRGIDTTTEFEDRVSAALAITDVRGIAGAVAAHFAKTEPPG
jgi:hypothetical protein